MANATPLQTFNSNKYMHAKCRLHFGVHATDYDDEYSREYVDWFSVNGVRVVQHCDPMAKGCNTTQTKLRPDGKGLHNCLSEYDLDALLEETTELKFAGKISDMVDECPYKGKIEGQDGEWLFSGKATVTCFIKEWPVPAAKRPPDEDNLARKGKAYLRCHEPNCTAKATAWLDRSPREGQKCKMKLNIYDTDFDEDHGQTEIVEWVKVNGEEVPKSWLAGTKWKQKRTNPCKEVYYGRAQPAKDEDGELDLLDGVALDTPTTEQITAMEAPVPGEERTESELNCRRRVEHPRDTSFLSRQPDNYPYHRRRGYHHAPWGLGYKDWDHARAAPDEMSELFTGRDVTQEIADHGLGIEVEAKISEHVDECGKDGYLLNGLAEVVCE